MLNQKESPQQIATRVNKLIPYYEFSDSNPMWALENEKHKTIARLLKGSTAEEVKEITKNLSTHGKLNYNRYFSKII